MAEPLSRAWPQQSRRKLPSSIRKPTASNQEFGELHANCQLKNRHPDLRSQSSSCLALLLCLGMQPVKERNLQIASTRHPTVLQSVQNACGPKLVLVPPKRRHAFYNAHILWQACECSVGSGFPSMRKGCRRPARLHVCPFCKPTKKRCITGLCVVDCESLSKSCLYFC